MSYAAPAERTPPAAVQPPVDWWRVGALIAAVTLLKALAVVTLGWTPRGNFEDTRLAESLARDGAFVLTHLGQANHTLQFPLYPLLAAGAYRLSGMHPAAGLLLNVLLGGATAWVFARLCDRWLHLIGPTAVPPHARRPVIWLCTGSVLLHPLLNQYAMTAVHQVSLVVLMTYVPLLWTVRYFERGERPRDLVVLGVIAGCLLLTRVTLMVTLLPFLARVARRAGWPVALARAFLIGLLGVGVSTPWLVHVWRTDRVLGYTSSTGEILWKGSLDGGDGSNFLSERETVRGALSSSELAHIRSLSVAAQNRYFLGRYAEALRREPARVARRYVVKLVNFFWFRALVGNTYEPGVRRLIPAYKLAYGIVGGLALLSLPLLGRRVALQWTVVLALGFLQAAFYVETRHRVVIEPVLVFLAATALTSAATRWRGAPGTDGPAGTGVRT